MAYGSVHGRYFAGKQVKCEFVSLTRWKVAICGEYMKSRLKTCSRGSACNFLHCFSNPGGDYEWADCDKPPPRYWVNKMTALFGYSDEPSPKDQQHSSMIFTSDKDSYHSKRHRSIDPSHDNGSSCRSHRDETHARKSRRCEHQKGHNVYENETEYNINHTGTDSDGDRLDRDSYHSKRHRSIDSSQHNGSSSRSHHKETHARKSRRQSRQEDRNVYEDEAEYKSKSNYPETDFDGDRLDKKRHDDRSENHIRKESKPRDNRRRTPGSRGSSSDEDLYTKWKSRHRKNISESSSNDAKTEPSEGELLRHKQKTKSSRRRSRHDDRDEMDHEESKKVEAHSRHRSSRRSHESEPKSDTNDRWQPHGYEISDDREPKDRRIDHGTKSGSVVEDALKDIQPSRDCDDRKREKRKRI